MLYHELLTHDGESDRPGLGVPLHVAGVAGVGARLPPGHLQSNTVRRKSQQISPSAELDSDLIQIFASLVFAVFPFPEINFYEMRLFMEIFGYVMKPSDFVWWRVGRDRTFEVDVVALLQVI